MRATRLPLCLLSTSAALAAVLGTPLPSRGLDIQLEFETYYPPATDPGCLKLQEICEYVAGVYEDVFEDTTQSVRLRFRYNNLDSYAVEPAELSMSWDWDPLGRITGAHFEVDDDAFGSEWFYDSTPADDSEFDMTPTLWRDLPSEWRTDYFSAGSNIPSTFEVGYSGHRNDSDPNTAGRRDLLSHMFRVMGQALGLCHADPTTLEIADRDYDFESVNVFGRTLAAQCTDGSATSPFLDDHLALEAAPGNLGPNERVRPSHTDLLSMAAANKYMLLDLPRREFYGGTDWNTPGNWSGNAIPGAGDAAFIRASGPAGEIRTVTLITDASVGTLTVSEGSNFETSGFQLTVHNDLFIDGLNTDFTIESGGLLVVTGSTIHVTNDAELRLTGGRIASVGTLSSSSAIIGHGTINVTSRLINSGSINVSGGTLVINAGSGSVNLDGTLSGLPSFEPGIVTITAANSDLVINGSLSDDFNGILTIGPANTVSISEPWTLGGAGGGTISSGRDGVVNLNGGTTSATAAILAGGTITVEGDLNIPAGSYGRIPAAVIFSDTPDGGATVVCDGTLQLSGATTTFNGGSYTGSGTLVFEGVTQTFAGSTTLDVARIDLDGGVSGNDVIVNSGVAVTINSAITDAFNSTLTINSGSFAVNGGAWTNAGTINLNKTTSLTPRISGSGLTLSGYVNVDGAAQIAAVLVNGGGTIAVAAGGTLTCSGGFNTITASTLTKTGEGTLILNGPQNHQVAPATLRATGGTVVFNSNAGAGGRNLLLDLSSNSHARLNTTQHLVKLNIGTNSTATLLAGGNRVLVTTLLSIDSGHGGALDLCDNDAVIDHSGSSPLAQVRSYLHTGRHGGAWNGSGIRSSLADATHALGYADNVVLGLTSFAGETVDSTSVLIKFTYAGDANLDGQVDITDLAALATHWQTSNFWTGGDFDYSGFVDITDLAMLATNWQAGVGAPLGQLLSDALASLGLPHVAVPEPVSAVAWLLLAGAAARRRHGSA